MELVLSNSLPAFGFLTVVEDEQHGFFGGYLLLSERGRPLEFHCSTPILPSKAQRILYGNTLRSFVLGELIGQTLVQKSRLSAQVVLTDLEEMLELGLFWQGDLAWISQARMAPLPQNLELHEVDELNVPQLELDGYRLMGSSTCNWLPEKIRGVLAPLVSHIDLAEPFERIREAIREAQRATDLPTTEGESHPAAA